MNYADRKAVAVLHIGDILADQRDDAEMRRDEQHARDAEDQAETAGRDAYDFTDDRPAPGFQRALDSARQSIFCQQRFHGSDAAQLDAVFGPDRDDDERELDDDEDDFIG